MSQSAKVTWQLPSVGATQAPIAYVDVQIAVKSDAPSFTSFSHVTPDQAQTETPTELDSGDWIVRLIVVDTQKSPKSSSSVDTPFNVPVASLDAPGPVTNVSVSLV